MYINAHSGAHLGTTAEVNINFIPPLCPLLGVQPITTKDWLVQVTPGLAASANSVSDS